MPLHTDFRPEQLSEFAGNTATVRKLESVLSRDDIPHTFLFSGPKGCGKTTLARIVGYMLGVTKADFKEYNSADYKRLADARELEQNVRLKPLFGKRRLFLLDECHALDKAAQRCLLKVLEEPPEHAFFTLCTTDPHLLLAPFKDRCSEFKVAPLSDKECYDFLCHVMDLAGWEGDKPESALRAIVTNCGGTPRRALVMLDQVIDIDPSEMEKYVSGLKEAEAEAIDLCRALVTRKGWKEISRILKVLKENGEDPEGIRRLVLGYCGVVLLGHDDPKVGIVMNCFEKPTYDIGFSGIILAAYNAFTTCGG